MKAKEATKSVSVRFPIDLHRSLKAAAKREGRSLNGQIKYTLRQALNQDGNKGDAA